MAAIQGLNQKLEEEVAELKARIEQLEALIAEMTNPKSEDGSEK